MEPTLLTLLASLPESAAETAELTTAQALVAAAVLSLVAAAMVPLYRKASRALLGPTPSREAAYGPVDLLPVFLAFVLGQGIVVEVYRRAAGLEEIDFDALEVLPALGLSAAGQGLTAAVILLLALRRPGGPATLGVRRLTPGSRGPFAASCYLLSFPALMALGALTAGLYSAAGADPPVQDTAVLVEGGLDEHPVWIWLLVAGVIPLLEEIIFRGFLLELLVSRLGVVAGVVLSSALFAFLHGWAVFLPIFGLAVVLAGVKLRTRSLGAAWFIHAVHNGLTTLLLTQGAFPS